MRDVLIHSYMGVGLETVRQVTRDRLPPLKAVVEKILARRSSPGDHI